MLNEWKTRLSRPWVVRAVVLLVIVSLLAPSAVSALTYEPSDTDLQRGTIESPAEGTTVISIQGFKFKGTANGKKPARLVGVGPRGNVKWIHEGSDLDVTWFYDVDPVNGSNLLVSGTRRGGTTIYEYNPQTDEIVWRERFDDIHDTHDADLINGDQLLVANMRNYNTEKQVNEDRIFIYDRSKDETVWEWQFRNHTDWAKSQGGQYASEDGSGDDWTHVNDVDKIAEGQYLMSPRNMDQVMVVNRSTKNIDMRLGSDNNYEVMNEQHNPTYLESQNGTPTILVADSHGDRVVEYAKRGGDWKRTWEVGSRQSFNWPRDADRLPNGNTLIVDSNNHRVVEVNSQGEIVWEFYAPWAPYDAERITYGDEAGGPTIADQNAEGKYPLTGSAGLTPGTGEKLTFSQWLSAAFAGTPISEPVAEFANQWSKIAPWVRPVWMGPWDFVGAVVAGLLLVGWLFGEVVYNRKRITSGVRRRIA
ncbi:aryl-sulfate sulfotransferase [Halorussus sp. MSC15.2]|uniref:aryl-sulfate sulfotransferase n=1 Tax=Halorussus sp. MSC15.2 TaxID=2283638 RepID=UPI0013D5AB30|nr:arylsulfotransferase family protein [Halorussus sp. MSC15.2]NEU58183.1 ArsR family transcriptional regulator [Halorussus sp. MSC15.2]